jgi:hypothetical protein
VAVLYTDASEERYWVYYFDLMPDSIFAAREARGATRAELSISKAEREADPITRWDAYNPDDWVVLAVPEPAGLLAATAALGMLSWLRRIGRQPLRDVRE